MVDKVKVEKNAHLVDKWVLTESIYVGGVVAGRPRLVTKVSNDRVYISRRLPTARDSDKIGELEEDSYVSFKKVQYVFDSEEKANDAAAQCKTLWDDWFHKQRADMTNESIRILKELSIG